MNLSRTTMKLKVIYWGRADFVVFRWRWTTAITITVIISKVAECSGIYLPGDEHEQHLRSEGLSTEHYGC